MDKIKIIQIVGDLDKLGVLGLGSDNRIYVFDYNDWFVYGNTSERLTFGGEIRKAN